MRRKLISEVLEEVQNSPDAECKIEFLQANDNPVLRNLLRLACDPKIKFDVPIPETWKLNDEVDGYSSNNIYVESKRLYLFEETYKLPLVRKTVLLVQILESIDPADAPVLIDILKKNLAKYGVTKEIVDQAFPGLIK